MALTIFRLAAIIALAFLVSSCASITQDECRAGDWETIGKRDAVEGHAPSRLEEHAKVCANFRIVPEEDAYMAGWDEGILIYCTPVNGFNVGRANSGYHGLCPAEVAGSFLEGRQVGLALGDVERRVASAQGRLDSAESDISRIRREINAIERNASLTESEKRRLTSDLRDDERRARRRMDDAEWELRTARMELLDYQRIASQFLSLYGGRL